jgi:translation initiation factor 2B subunit (eIF-2B alpha/beta/delta family)
MDFLSPSLKRLLRDRRSGSSVIASRFCRLCLADIRGLSPRADPARLKRGIEALIESFPAMALLYSLRDRLRRAVQDRAHCSADIQRQHLVDLFASFLSELEDCRRQAALHFAGVAGRHKSFLTLSASGAVLEACAVLHDHLSRARRRRPGPTVIVCESRPAREGIAMARRLYKAGCTVTLIADAAMGHWIEEVDAVLLGADWIDRKGFINKTGSLALSKLALLQRKPVYVIGDTLRIRKEIFPASRLPKADPTEVLKRREPGLAVENRYFERVPWNAPHVLVTEAGTRWPGRASTR